MTEQEIVTEASVIAKVADQLAQAIAQRDVQVIASRLKAMRIVAPPEREPESWSDLLTRFAQAIPDAMQVRDTYPWELRAFLLQAWGGISTLEKSEHIPLWLSITWEELQDFLLLALPHEWYVTAISILLVTPPTIPMPQMISIVNNYASLFEQTLHQLMTRAETQPIALSFFGKLIKHGYLAKLRLLAMMLDTNVYQQERIEELLRLAQLRPMEITDLLENYCQKILSQYELTTTLSRFVSEYLYNLNVDDLYLRPTQALLRRLQQRNMTPALMLPLDLQHLVQGWLRLAQWMQSPLLERKWLDVLHQMLKDMSALPSEAWMLLVTQVLSLLVKHIATEADLVRTIDVLGSVLLPTKGAEKDEEPALRLLEQLVITMREYQGQQLLAISLAPYMKVVLGEAQHLPSDEKESFIERCLTTLLAESDTATLMLLDAHTSLWSTALQLDWKAYSDKHALLPLLQENMEEVDVAHSDGEAADTQPLAPITLVDDDFVASVHGQKIGDEVFQNMCALINPYLHYEYNCRPIEIYELLGMVKSKEPPALLKPTQLRRRAVETLVHDILIQEGIHEAITRHGVSAMNFDTEKHVATSFQRFKSFFAEQYADMRDDAQLSDEDVIAIIRIYVRRDLFGLYLYRQVQPKLLFEWLEERLSKADAVIHI